MAPVARHLQHGSAAEALAARYLASQGLSPLASNFRCRFGELDLVMTHRHVLVVVEVRSRRRTNVTAPGATVNRGKQRRLIGATRFFLLRFRQFASCPVRFDVKTMRRPSGAQRARPSSAGWSVSRRSGPPPAGTT